MCVAKEKKVYASVRLKGSFIHRVIFSFSFITVSNSVVGKTINHNCGQRYNRFADAEGLTENS